MLHSKFLTHKNLIRKYAKSISHDSVYKMIFTDFHEKTIDDAHMLELAKIVRDEAPRKG